MRLNFLYINQTYLWCTATYAFLLSVALLAPFNFFIARHFQWIDGTNGIALSSIGVVSSSPPQRLHDDLLTGTGITVEIWAATHLNQQEGPARLLSYSGGYGSERNFTVGQDGRDLFMVLRATTSVPKMAMQNVFEFDEPRHIVFTYDFVEQRAYIDGNRQLHALVPRGDFSNWESSYVLNIGNEVTGDRPWVGQLFLVAVYNRALSEAEIQTNYAAGPTADVANAPWYGRVEDGLVAFYPFTEGKGEYIGDGSRKWPPVDLQTPVPLPPKYAFLSAPWSENASISPSRVIDMIGNIFIFIPFGYFFYRWIRRSYRSSLKLTVFILTVATLFALGIESLQYFLEARFSSVTDVVNNTIGTALGIALAKRHTMSPAM
jgi:VanZ family protein